jgi:cell wall-active antibiotic response 4TMS protein YvqF/uncharacterized protein DUF2154
MGDFAHLARLFVTAPRSFAMRWNRLFWPLILIVVGGLLLLDNLKIISINFWQVIIPLALILAGLSVLAGSLQRATRGVAESLMIPAEGVESAKVRIRYGAGKVTVAGKALPGKLLDGTFEGGVEDDVRREGKALNVELNATTGDDWMWWNGGRREWSMGLSNSLPVALEIETGAAETRLDLSDVKVTDLRLKTGATSTSLSMPASAGMTTARLEGGAASMDIRFPAEVGARIRWEGGMASIHVDTDRFPKSGDTYESKGYAEARNKVDLKISMGMGSVDIK